MRIVIDMQGAQGSNRQRGIGRYTFSLAQAIIRNRGDNEVFLALNGLIADTIEPIRAEFDGLLPQANIQVWHAPGPVRECDPGNEWRREVAERIREAFLVSLRPDVVFIPSFFEGYQNDGVTSVGLFAPSLISVIALDAIDAAQTNVATQGECTYALRKLENLKRADLLLAMQPLSVDEVCKCFEVSKERVKDCLMVGEAETDLQDATTWARNLLKIFEELATARPQPLRLPQSTRPKLAYVSPLPPERSGISDYSAELLPELTRFYDIDVIVAQAEITSLWITANCGVRTIDWFLQNAQRYSRVLYHFGNSHFHEKMFDLLARIPGDVVLHDFYLGDVNWYREAHALFPYAWTSALYMSHGYGAVAERFHVGNAVDAVRKYPVNLEVLQQAQGVIVHSEHSRQLANEWYGNQFANDWAVIPLLRVPSSENNRDQARKKLGIKPNDFVVCSFGMLGPTKLNHRLLEAWLHARLSRDERCVLVFVGENHSGDYGTDLLKTIHKSGFSKRIRVTGWADTSTFRNYLAAADIAVQLRTNSRGETSAAVLDCMNYALPTIINANGTMAELPPDTVCMLPDAFEDHQLVEVLETLWQDGERRGALGKRGQEVILNRHAPRVCAKQYADAIEQFNARSQSDAHSLVKAIADLEGYSPTDSECRNLAQTITQSLPTRRPVRQLLLDISATCRTDLKTGIERVARALVMAMLESPPTGYRVEPVYLTNEGGVWHYRYARSYTLGLLECPPDALVDEVVEPCNGDVLLGLDLSGQMLIEAGTAGLFTYYRNIGVVVNFIVFDLLPVQMPRAFPSGAEANHAKWLQTIAKFDGAICISHAVADELSAWLKTNSSKQQNQFRIGWFHLGADVGKSAPTKGLPNDADETLAHLSARPSFLMVGTIEPRKGYLQTLETFTRLWREGLDINLVIVGKEGWQGLPDDMRRTIPEIINRLRNHPELNKHLYWLEGVSDEYLEKVYAASTCLIAASEGEGFGLPLIEAAQHKKPIIARDIPVFREVAGEHAFYFRGLAPKDLADAVKHWLALNVEGKTQQSVDMPWLTWRQSAEQLISRVLP